MIFLGLPLVLIGIAGGVYAVVFLMTEAWTRFEDFVEAKFREDASDSFPHGDVVEIPRHDGEIRS